MLTLTSSQAFAGLPKKLQEELGKLAERAQNELPRTFQAHGFAVPDSATLAIDAILETVRLWDGVQWRFPRFMEQRALAYLRPVQDSLNELINQIANAKSRGADAFLPMLPGLRESAAELYHFMVPLVAGCARPDSDDAERIRGELELRRSEMNQLRDELKATVEQARAAVTEGQVVAYAASFRKAAEDHRSTARSWLGAAAAVGLCLVGGVYWWIRDLSVSQVPAVAALLAAVAAYGLTTCLRNHKANLHVAVVNEHRANALASFDAFLAASKSDAETKRAVLIETARCIFSPSVTGYLGGGENMPETPLTTALRKLE